MIPLMLNPNYLVMIDIIIDIYNQLTDFYQYFFGVPEGFGDNGYRRHGEGKLGIYRCCVQP